MTIEGEGWAPGIGDPTMVGWASVLAYFICALLCFAASNRRQFVVIKREDRNANPKVFWLSLGLFLIVLGINKQLDLQTLFAQIGRNLAIQQGWYEDRQMVQLVFIAVLGVIGTLIAILAITLIWHSSAKVKLALIGCAFLFLFILTRATSFHKIDRLLGANLGGAKINWILELGGIGLIMIAALAVLIHRPR